MSERGVKLFLAMSALYFVTKDIGALVVYSRREDSCLQKWLKGRK